MDNNYPNNIDYDNDIYDNDIIYDDNENNIIYDNDENNINNYSNQLDNPNICQFSLPTYSLIFYHDYNSINHLEDVNKIVLPSSVLNRINRFADDINGNIIFQLKGNSDLYFYVSVEQFIDDISDAYIPVHLMDRLLLNDGDNVEFALTNNIPKGTKITLQAHSCDILEMEDYKSFLEMEINKKYDILTCGETISLQYQEQPLYFDIKSTSPNDIISIKNTDLQVEFEEPLNYQQYLQQKELEKKAKQQLQLEEKKKQLEIERKKQEDERIKKEKGFVPFGGVGRRLGD